MACITADATAAAHLLEQAVLSAAELDAELLAVHVEGPRQRHTDRQQANLNLTLFASAGARVVRLRSSDTANRFLEYARVHEIERIIVSRDHRSFLDSFFGRELWRQMVRKGHGFQIQMVDLR